MLTDDDLARIRNILEETLKETLEAYGFRRLPSPAAARMRRYRERQLAAGGRHVDPKWRARIEYHGWKCRYCGEPLTEDTVTKDHAIPLSRGGTDWPANLVPACRSCNSSKRDKTPSEFKAYRGS